MRPVRLELEGFSTFRQRVVLDFDGLDLVAFTGSTGAGKSTLIDAITFALYGSVARYENASRVAPVIHQLSNQARVRLDFETGGQTYIATRVVKRKTTKPGEPDQASTREARLERTTGSDDETTVLAGDVKELNAAVEELLGLDFKQFTRTIVLPQGEFAAFLRDEPATRDRLLQRLLDLGIYERMGQMARSEAKRADHQREILAEQLQRNPALDDAAFASLSGRVGVLEELRTTGEGKLEELTGLDALLDPLREDVKRIDNAVERLESIDVPEQLSGLDRQLQEAAAAATAAGDSLQTARTERDTALAELDGLTDKGELVRVLSLVEQLVEAEQKIEQTKAVAVEVADAATKLEAEQVEIDELLAAAEATARSARQAADAADWTAALEVGQPCPVCHRDVETIPDHDAAQEMELAESERRRLASDSKRIATQLAKTLGTREASVDEIARQSERLDLLNLQLSAFEGSNDPAVLAAELETVEKAEIRHRSTSGVVSDVEGKLQTATTKRQEIEEALQSMVGELAALRDSLADLEPPVISHESLVEDYDVIQRWAKERATELGEERADLAAEGKRVAKERGRLAEEVAEVSASAEFSGAIAAEIATDPSRLLQALGDEIATTKADVASAKQRRDDHAELSAQVDELTTEGRLNEAIGRHLRSGGFSSWLLSEALENIVAKATFWLRGLSNDQYSLITGDKNFAIIDHNNADETRDVRTLSGGETFLASLALALALADSIAELAPVDSPRLESMFLDEGFGTLDPGTLDVVAGAIEELASTGRMIGIVTHVSDLAERMPARFEVRKGPATSTVELVHT